MAKKNLASQLVNSFFKLLLISSGKSYPGKLKPPKKILIVRQHNQLGDLLAGVSLFRALKETYPDSHISLVVSPLNHPGVIKNKFLDKIFIFDKKKLISPFYFLKTIKFLREEYDLVIVPVVVSISFTSNLLARLANAKTRIGANSLDGKLNSSSFFFDRRIDIDWRKHPDSNVSERSLDIVRPFGINTNNYSSEITFDDVDIAAAQKFIDELRDESKKFLIGLHVGAGKPNNRWSLEKYAVLVKKINNIFPSKFYLTGGWAEKEELNYLDKNVDIKSG